MTTIAPKQAPVATFIDDLASALTGLSDWEDADTNVSNDQFGNGFRNNGRVFHHTTTGRYVLFYASSRENFKDNNSDNNDISGVRFVYSTGWDTSNSLPEGKSTAAYPDIFYDESAFNSNGASRSNNFEDYDIEDKYVGQGCWFIQKSSVGESKSDYATNTQVNYFISARNDGITIGCWSSSNEEGFAGWHSYEQTSGKFWNDGVSDWCLMTKHNSDGDQANILSYGWRYADSDNGGYHEGQPRCSGLERSRWGFINSSVDDDTYFVQYGLLYSTTDENRPSVYTTDVLRNDPGQGAAHADEVTYDGKTYKVMKQSGFNRSSSQSVSVLLRYE